MNPTTTYLNQITTMAIVLLVIAAFEAAGLFIFFIHQQTTKVAKQTCADFTTYQEALQDYNRGNTGLDHNKNGYPCENLL